MKFALAVVGSLLCCSLASAQRLNMDKLLDKRIFSNGGDKLLYRLR